MFVPLMEIVLGVGLVVAVFLWICLDNRWLSSRIDQLDDDVDRGARSNDERFEQANERIRQLEGWLRVLIEERQAGAQPTYRPEPEWAPRHIEQPSIEPAITVVTIDDIEPGEVPTQPVALPETQPQEVVLLSKLDGDQWLEEAMARIKAIAEGAA